MKGAAYFDLDGTLAYYEGWEGMNMIGDPIPEAIELVKKFLDIGWTVKILTARANEKQSIPYVEKWIKEHVGTDLEVTNIKGADMTILFDDRAVAFPKNTGRPCCGWGQSMIDFYLKGL